MTISINLKSETISTFYSKITIHISCGKIVFCVSNPCFFKIRFFITINNFVFLAVFSFFRKINNKLCLLNSQVLKINVAFFYQGRFLLTHVKTRVLNEWYVKNPMLNKCALMWIRTKF
jgi:hypothetical protein